MSAVTSIIASMASRSDTERAAIRERKRQAQVALRERLETQERLQDAAFAALDRLATQLDRAAESLGGEDNDTLQRAATTAAITGELGVLVTEVQRTANALVTGSDLTQAAVADLLGVRSAALFPRARAVRSSGGPRHAVAGDELDARILTELTQGVGHE